MDEIKRDADRRQTELDESAHDTSPSHWPEVTLELDVEVIDRFRKGGPGWQGRINEALREAVGLG